MTSRVAVSGFNLALRHGYGDKWKFWPNLLENRCRDISKSMFFFGFGVKYTPLFFPTTHRSIEHDADPP